MTALDWRASQDDDLGTGSLLTDLLLPESDVVHCLMPCMALACDVDALTAMRRGWKHGSSAETTCEACLTAYGDLAGLRAEMDRQMGHQAPVVGEQS